MLKNAAATKLKALRTREFSVFLFVQLIAFTAIFLSTRGRFSYVVNDGNELILPEILRGGESNTSISSTNQNSSNTVRRTETSRSNGGLPTLEELTSIPQNYSCPKGYVVFNNTVLPESITHANRKIPKVVHVTAKSRCVTPTLKEHISRWILKDHSLYFHDDSAAHKLLEYTVHDLNGLELVQNMSKLLTCISNGATLSDLWRYTVLYHFGGIYTDIDNGPGKNYTTDLISPEADSFFFVESLGTMSQYYFASSHHHPMLLHFLKDARRAVYHSDNNVMINNPAKMTGPGAVKRGMIEFMRALDPNTTTNGYLEEGIYVGALGAELESQLPWLHFRANHSDQDDDERRDRNDYASISELTNRTVTVFGNKKLADGYINRKSLRARQKKQAWDKMNMTHYSGLTKRFPRNHKISCEQHVSRIDILSATNTSFYYNKSRLAEITPNYEFNHTDHYYYDANTNEKVIPWGDKAAVVDDKKTGVAETAKKNIPVHKRPPPTKKKEVKVVVKKKRKYVEPLFAPMVEKSE